MFCRLRVIAFDNPHALFFEVWRMQYKMPFPITNREFTEVLLTRDQPPDPTTGNKSFLVVSVPVLDTGPAMKDHVRARYISVEYIEEVGEGTGPRRIRWRWAYKFDVFLSQTG